MSPILTPQNADSAELNRIVRLENVFYFDENYRGTHRDIAIKNGVPESEKPVVTDAGFLAKSKEKFYIEGDSISCAIKGDPRQAREESQKLLRETLGPERAI
jgi:hypothetical protein